MDKEQLFQLAHEHAERALSLLETVHRGQALKASPPFLHFSGNNYICATQAYMEHLFAAAQKRDVGVLLWDSAVMLWQHFRKTIDAPAWTQRVKEHTIAEVCQAYSPLFTDWPTHITKNVFNQVNAFFNETQDNYADTGDVYKSIMAFRMLGQVDDVINPFLIHAPEGPNSPMNRLQFLLNSMDSRNVPDLKDILHDPDNSDDLCRAWQWGVWHYLDNSNKPAHGIGTMEKRSISRAGNILVKHHEHEMEKLIKNWSPHMREVFINNAEKGLAHSLVQRLELRDKVKEKLPHVDEYRPKM